MGGGKQITVFCFLLPGSSSIAQGHWWALLLLVLLIIFIALLIIIILQQPENPKRLPYMAPCVPLVPASAMLVNIYLMLKLSAITWIRFSIWCFVGKWTLHRTWRNVADITEPKGMKCVVFAFCQIRGGMTSCFAA